MKRNVCIVGDGGWGTALALLLRQNGHAVAVWSAFPEQAQDIRTRRENRLFLPGVPLPEDIRWTADREEAARAADLAVLAVPTRFYREVAASFRGLFPPSARIVSVSKGLDPQTRRRMTEVAAEALGQGPVATLSGPSHAEEVARGIPTAVALGCADADAAREVQTLFGQPRFRVYTSTDVAGVELGGALKNVIAIAVGISDGMGFGDNTRAALITRGLAEISRLGCALGAQAATFAGLSGMGDLIVTCTSRHSRNRAVGERLGRGEKIREILAGMRQVAEGVGNCPLVCALAREAGVDVPVSEEVRSILEDDKNPRDAVASLLARDFKPE
jgi:glycerol-3-phosphate dehydrogenase (NAD(P)+)